MQKIIIGLVLFSLTFICSPLIGQTLVGADIDGEAAGDRSGTSISLSSDGNRMAIGAISNDGNGNDAGHVRIYDYSGGSWTQIGADIDGEFAGDLSGHSVSLSANGNRVAIGAFLNPGNGPVSGHTRIFEYNSGSWSQVGADINGEAAFDFSGWSVALSADGNTVAIGSRENDDNGSNSGHVRVFQFGSGNWSQVGADIAGEAAGDFFGWSVSLSSDGSRVAIGAIYNDGNGSNSGHVQVYQFGAGNWSQVGADMDGEAAGDWFGSSVSLSSDGNQVAIGARSNDGNGSNSGHVRIFNFSGGAWNQLGADIDGEAAGDNFGTSVSLSSGGNRVAIGAPYNSAVGPTSGHVRIFDYVSGSWNQVGTDIDGEAVNDNSGTAVSLSADGLRVAIGAPGNSGNGSQSGHARVYGLTAPPPSPFVVSIPTLSQWGLILLALLILNFGALAIGMQEANLSLAGSGSFDLSRLPFDKKKFGKYIIIVAASLISLFSISILGFDYELTNADVPCSILAVPLLAYFLFQLKRK